jgi:hypothetical protein
LSRSRSIPVVTARQAAALRLARQHLRAREPATVAAVASDVCGIQAQVASAAELALWSRSPGLTRAGVHDALWKHRTLVKTSAMRGTLHLLAADELALYVAAFAGSRVRRNLGIMARYGVTRREASAVKEAALDALAAGPLSRAALAQAVLGRVEVNARARRWFEESWWGVARQAVVEGLLCYGPDEGREAALVRVDRWLGPQAPVAESQARALLLRRYLRAHGPATLRDFAKWSGLAMVDARVVWQHGIDDMQEVSVEGKPAFLLLDDFESIAEPLPPDAEVRLLPSFDPYLLAHADVGHFLAPEHYKRVYKGAGWLAPVVLHGGRVVATWSYARRSGRLEVEVAAFGTLSKPVRGLIVVEAADLGRFFGLPGRLSRVN